MKLIAYFLIFSIFSVWAKATEYQFSAGTFELGRWSPTTLSYKQGLRKIETLDKWWESLTQELKVQFTKAYNLNRNRLFLITQEKRLKSEIDRPLSRLEIAKDQIQPSWIAAGRRVLEQERQKMYSDLRALNIRAMADEEALSREIFSSLADISKIGLKDPVGTNFAPSFSKSISKSIGSTLSMHSQTSCKDGDQECLEKQSEAVAHLGSHDIAKFLQEIKRSLKEVGLAHPICGEYGHVGPAPGSAQSAEFQKKRDNFLKNIGSQNWKPSKTENDLSRWYSEPMSQWTEGKPNAKCVGHAISSDIASVVNKNSVKKYAVSPHSTYAQIQVITREDLERKKTIGTITPDENAILDEFTNVQPIDSKHADFCNPSFYQVDDYLGALYIDNSLNYVFKAFQNKPLCGNRALPSNRGKTGAPLFTVDKFESMEFEKPSDQALDYDFFRRMIDTGNPPIVTIDSDARTESGDWLHIQGGKRLAHALNVVGYGEDIDPITLCKVRYLKIRDSLGQKKIYYKVPADNFISHIVGVYKVTSVKKQTK